MHECIGLAVVTRDEAEAFHRVEELYRAGGLFAGQFALRRCRAGFNRDNVAYNLKVGSGNFSATIDKVEFELLTFGQTFKTGAFHGADVNEDVFATIFTLNEAEALLAVEKLYGAFAGADNLGWHAATTAATAARAAAEAAATTGAAAEAATTATGAATIAATETTTITAAEATAIAKAAAATAEVVTAAETAVGIEIVFAETVPLVASASAPPSVKTHINQ